jgi:hypothetical protein
MSKVDILLDDISISICFSIHAPEMQRHHYNQQTYQKLRGLESDINFFTLFRRADGLTTAH